MGRKLRSEQIGVFPGSPTERHGERNRVLGRVFAHRAGLPDPELQPSEYKNLGNRNLPVWGVKRKIQDTVRDYQLSMLDGPTGSGKSTQLAQYALEMGYEKIIYLEPRIALADNLADRLITEFDMQLGEGQGDALVGVRHSERSTGFGKAVEIMTPDTFLRVRGELERYSDSPLLAIGDEIHEKDFSNELAVAVVARALPDHLKWRLCVVSATLDSEPIKHVYESQLGKPVPIVSIEGRPFDLEMTEEPESTVEDVYDQYRSNHTKAQLFTSGKQEIRDITDAISSKRYPNTRITPLHAKQSREKNRRATHAQLAPHEKQVIPSTNAGASGLTIPGQTLVISDGTVRRPDLNEDGVPGLFREYCSQAELIQQAGRAGRDVPGGVFVLARPEEDSGFTFRSPNEREPYAPAQIYHTNIARNVLAVTALGEDFYDLNNWLINGITKTRRIIEAYDVLYRLGAIDEENRLTKVGEQMNQLPLRPELGRAMVAAHNDNIGSQKLRWLAATVSAIENGGLPYFERGVSTAWRDDIRRMTTDDYGAQLDMFIATRPYFNGHDVNEARLEEKNYDLQQTKKAHKTYDRICRTLGITSDDKMLHPDAEESQVLRDYLAIGLFDFAHQQVSDGVSRQSEYTSIFGVTGDAHRTLSDRGTYKGGDHLVIGMPRRFEKRIGGAAVEFSTIENVMPVTVDMLARAALHLAQRVPATSRVESGRLVAYNDIYLGDIRLGSEAAAKGIVHTKETRSLLREAAFQNRTQALQELIAIKKELEWLARRVPDARLTEFFPAGIMTKDWLDSAIEQAIDDGVDTIYALDNNLRRKVLNERISVTSWVNAEKKQKIIDNSPDYIELSNGQNYQLYYTHGRPLINGFNLCDAKELPDTLLLPDGREVLINFRIERDTKTHTARDIREYAASLVSD